MDITIDTVDAVDLTPPALPPFPKSGVAIIDDITTRVLGGGYGEEQAAETLESVTGPLGISGGSGIEEMFIRAVVIILGFIFVAVGLSMFRGGT